MRATRDAGRCRCAASRAGPAPPSAPRVGRSYDPRAPLSDRAIPASEEPRRTDPPARSASEPSVLAPPLRRLLFVCFPDRRDIGVWLRPTHAERRPLAARPAHVQRKLTVAATLVDRGETEGSYSCAEVVSIKSAVYISVYDPGSVQASGLAVLDAHGQSNLILTP